MSGNCRIEMNDDEAQQRQYSGDRYRRSRQRRMKHRKRQDSGK